MKITVAIPTIAGRSRYLGATLASCLSQDVDDVEFLVSDNPGSEARDIVAALDDPRLRYVQPPQFLHMSGHWDFVLGQARGDAICIIGDDDALMPGCLEAVKELHREFGNVPIHHSLANYYWPDSLNAADHNKVLFFHELFDGARWVDSTHYLKELARGTRRYLDGPMVYHNFVPMHVLRSRMQNGVYFQRSSPDVYSAVAVAASCERFLSVGKVLTIAGQGARSSGVLVRTTGADARKLLAQAHDPRYAPRYTSRTVQLHVLDTVLEVAQRFNRPEVESAVDYSEHLRWAIAETLQLPTWRFQAQEARGIAKAAWSHGVVMQLLAGLARTAGRRLSRIASAPNPAMRIQPGDRLALPHDVPDVYEATKVLARILDERARDQGTSQGMPQSANQDV